MLQLGTINGFTVTVDTLGGRSPVQATGRIAERDWYFRARGQHWSVAIGRRVDADGYVRPAGADLYVSGPASDIRPYAAGHMPDDEVARHLTFALTLWATGACGEVEIPDSPNMRPPCVKCGAEADHRVGSLSVCSAHLDNVRAALGVKDGAK